MSQRRPRSPWRPLSMAAAGLSVALAVGACGVQPTEDSKATPQRGGTLTFALDSSPGNLDPNFTHSSVNAEIMRQIFDSLVRQKQDGTFVPWLAKSWDIAEDGRTYTFQLRDDVKFHDGTQFNAEAVCFNFDRIVNPETQSQAARAALGPTYKSCDATGKYEVTIRLSEPYNLLMSGLSQVWLGFESPTAVRKYGKDIGSHPVGTGPFVFESMTLNQKVVLKRNPDYRWAPEGTKHTGPAYLDTLIFEAIPDSTTRLKSVGGDVQAAETIATQDVAAAKANPNVHLDVVGVPGTPYQLFFNTKRSPWNDTEMRKAARAAMNIPAIVKSLYFGVYQRGWGPLTPNTPSYDKSVENSFKYDEAAAKRTFDSLGWKQGADGYRHKAGKTLSIDYLVPSEKREKRQQVAQFLQQNLKSVGIKLNLRFAADGPYHAALYDGDYDIAGLSLIRGPSVLNDEYTSTNLPAAGGGTIYNYARLQNDKVDRWLATALHATDPADVRDAYSKVQNYVVDNAVSVAIYRFSYTVVASSQVHDIAYNWKSYPVFYDAFLSS